MFFKEFHSLFVMRHRLFVVLIAFLGLGQSKKNFRVFRILRIHVLIVVHAFLISHYGVSKIPLRRISITNTFL